MSDLKRQDFGFLSHLRTHLTVCFFSLITLFSSFSLPVPSPPTSGGIKPCTDAPPVPTNAVLKYQFGRNGSYGRYYECKKESGWVFGTTGRLTQCLMGKWTPIYDMCDEGESLVAGVGLGSFSWTRGKNSLVEREKLYQ